MQVKRQDRRSKGLLRTAAARATTVVAVAGAATALVTTSALTAPAGAAAPGPHDAIGAVSTVKAVTGGLTFTGWALDRDAPRTNDTVAVIVDGRTRAASVLTSVKNSTVTTKYKAGPTPGFTITARIATGAHTACVVARTIGTGLDTVLKCVTTPLGKALTSSQTAAHNPVGKLTSASAASSSVRVKGWASDPDFVSRRSTVVLYVDGRSAATVVTHSYPAPRPAAAGYASLYDITVRVASGMHLGCIWVVNVGLGSNAFQGCKALDTRGAAGTGAVTTPSLNTKVLAEAKKHLGQRYVWGAEGPKTFDCSGLVQYSYARNGYMMPRVSGDQAVKARLIPASRAVPGDLVFYHDTEGDVYHVGIYVSPGRTIAAIDPAEGVAYQTIWDPSSATYGSFTHK